MINRNGKNYIHILISENEYNEFSTQSLIDKLYSGSAKNLIESLLGSKKLNKSDIEELKDMFNIEDV
ncbi:MAG: BlaI/MecI/CopY family transcriptional regulator [Clostridiales bacterium]